MKRTQIMLDLETLGTEPGSVILSIGAVKFGEGKILSEFYANINASSCQTLGLKIDAATVMWWMMQSDEARKAITTGSKHISDALTQFSEWVGDAEAEVWGNGAGFDNTLLRSAYSAHQLTPPWKFTNDRCYRTVKNLHPEIKMERKGTHHNALDDARSQAVHLMEILGQNVVVQATPAEEFLSAMGGACSVPTGSQMHRAFVILAEKGVVTLSPSSTPGQTDVRRVG